METERKVIIKLKKKQIKKFKNKNLKIKMLKYLLYFFIIFIVVIIMGIIIFIYIYKLNLNQNNFSKLLFEKLYQIFNIISNPIKLKEKEQNNTLYFNNNINEKYKNEQNYFCDNQNNFYNKEFEDKIQKLSVDLNDKQFNILAYSLSDYISNIIYSSKSWEKTETNLY